MRVVVLDRNSQRIVWFNAAATRLLGLRRPRDIDGPWANDCNRCPSRTGWLRAATPNRCATCHRRSTQDVRLSLRLIPYSDELWLLVARDVSKLVRLEQMRRDFVANVSHELRTPLTVVHGYLEMLEPAEQPDVGADARAKCARSRAA